MTYQVERAEDTDRDLEIIFDFLFESFLAFGEDAGTALERASQRVLAVEDAMAGLGKVPHQGTLRPEFGEGLRHVTKERAVFYFEVDDEARVVRVLAVFYGAQDHRRKMLLRMLSGTTRP
jgi:plasmid stabilization system protein ParE